MKIKNILAVVPALIPSVNIGIIAPMKQLQKEHKIKFKVTLSTLFRETDLDSIDLVIFCRNTELYDLDILDEVLKRNIAYIYEIDDNFFEIPLQGDLGRYHRHPLRLNALKKIIQNASLVRTYSKSLYNDISRYNKNVVHLNVHFDLQLINTLQKDESSNKIKIIYATSRMEDNQQAIFDEALMKIANEYPDKVDIYFWGAPIANEELKKSPNIFHLKPIYNYEKFIQKFYSMGFDIGLAPVFGSKFYNSKTNNKYREYGACKIAGVYSDEPLYSCITSEENGVLVENNSKSWYEGIKQLIDDDILRNKMVKNAFIDIEENYSFNQFCKTWYEQIDAILNKNNNSTKQLNYISSSQKYNIGLIYAEYESELYGNFISKIRQLYSIYDIDFTLERVIDIDSDIVYSHYDNIFLFTSNEVLIENLTNIEIDPKKKIVVFTTLDIQNKKDNFQIITINIQQSLSIYDSFEKNTFALIDNQLTSFALIGTNKENFIIRNLKKISVFKYMIEKLTYLWDKQNSIRLRLSSYWTIFKINNNL